MANEKKEVPLVWDNGDGSRTVIGKAFVEDTPDGVKVTGSVDADCQQPLLGILEVSSEHYSIAFKKDTGFVVPRKVRKAGNG